MNFSAISPVAGQSGRAKHAPALAIADSPAAESEATTPHRKLPIRMDLGISGRCAAVAAASSGLGFAAAEALAGEGVRVAICSRDAERIDAAAARIGSAATPFVCDVATIAGATSFIERARSELGQIDIVIANCGGPPPGNFASTELAAYAPAFEQNALSTIAMCHAAVPEMRRRRWGRIVAITSIAVREPIGQLILSNTARTGLTSFLKTLAREIAGDGVTVNSLQPGLHETDRMRQIYGDDLEGPASDIPVGEPGRAEDFGRLAAMVCSDHARFLTGAAIPIDGGGYAGLQ